MEIKVLKNIVAFLFGYKYYANIVNTRGVYDPQLCSFIFSSKADADAHRRDIEEHSRSFSFVERVSFRSRIIYNKKV